MSEIVYYPQVKVENAPRDGDVKVSDVIVITLEKVKVKEVVTKNGYLISDKK